MSVRSPTAGTWSSSQWRPDNEFETDKGYRTDEQCRLSSAFDDFAPHRREHAGRFFDE